MSLNRCFFFYLAPSRSDNNLDRPFIAGYALLFESSQKYTLETLTGIRNGQARLTSVLGLAFGPKTPPPPFFGNPPPLPWDVTGYGNGDQTIWPYIAYVLFWLFWALPFLGPLEGWALKIETFLRPYGARLLIAISGPKKVPISGPTPSIGPPNGFARNE